MSNNTSLVVIFVAFLFFLFFAVGNLSNSEQKELREKDSAKVSAQESELILLKEIADALREIADSKECK